MIRAFTCMLCAMVVAVCAPASPSPRLQGRIIGVVDGDTVKILVNRAPVTVRLYGVDAPEKKQPFGARASAFLSRLAFGKDVTFTVSAKDRNRRWVADLILSDGKSLSEELLKSGHAWWFQRYAPRDHRLEKLETEARRGRVGLWIDARPIPPWVWRSPRGGRSGRPLR